MKIRILTALVIVFSLLLPSYGDTLTVPLIGQEMSNWCWNASSEMVLEYYGFAVNQTDIANWAVDGQNVGNSLNAQGIVFQLKWPLVYYRYGCKQVLANPSFGPVNSTFLSTSLTLEEIKSDIDGKRPAILVVRWLSSKGKDRGGHAIVLCGYEGDLIRLNDPWPSDDSPGVGNPGVAYLVDRSALFTAGSTYYGSAIRGNRWSQTLRTGRALDLCFLIDSTGSMWDDIDSVKAVSLELIDDLENNYRDLRIAVVDYRDYPESPYGGYSDWITNVQTPFTSNATTARNAINAISDGGGADWPEAVFSAVRRTMSGSEIGTWRENAERRIILMGDAPGHNPEPWAGGYSYADVIAYWQSLTNKISIHALYIGGDEAAKQQFHALAGDTGGSTRYADAAAGVPGAMDDLIDEFTETPRFPRDETMSLKPVFSFIPPTESMGPPVKNVLLEIQKWKTKKAAWKRYKKKKLSDTATSWTCTKPLPKGDYRWRVGYVRKSGIFTLPSGESRKIKGATLVEVDWTEFTRVHVDPSNPEQLTPSSSFTAASKKISYKFTAAVNATKYAMKIYRQNSKGEWKRWKKLKVKPSKKDPTATILEVKVKGHKIGAEYIWYVQSLNYDRPKPVDDAWIGD